MSTLHLLGRICFAAIFVMSGLSKFQDPKPALGYTGYGLSKFGITDASMVAAAFWTAAVLELVGGLAIVFNHVKLGGALIAAFLVPVTAALHDPRSGKMDDTIAFMKNLALFGTCLCMMATCKNEKAAHTNGGKAKAH